MGIPGLFAYVQKHEANFAQKCTIKTGGYFKIQRDVTDPSSSSSSPSPSSPKIRIGLLVDGNGLACKLYQQLDWILGGEYQVFEEKIQRFCDCFCNKLKMELRVFIDGSFESSKLETILERRKQTMRHCKSSWSHLPADLFPDYHPPSPSPSLSPSFLSSSTSSTSSSGVISKEGESQYQSFPPWFMSVFVKTLQENGVEVFMCSKEGDYELMQFYHWAKVNHFTPSSRPPLSSPSTPVTWAVLAQDTDYLMFPDLDYYFPLSEFNWESINLKVDKRQQQQQQQRQPPNQKKKKKKKKRKGKSVSSPFPSSTSITSPVPPILPSVLPSPSSSLAEYKPPQYRLNCLRFSASMTANAFKIQRSMLPLFATLLGNDHTNSIVEEYKLHQLTVNSRRPSGASRRFESIMTLSSYISQSYPPTRKNSEKNGRTIDLFEITKQISRKVRQRKGEEEKGDGKEEDGEGRGKSLFILILNPSSISATIQSLKHLSPDVEKSVIRSLVNAQELYLPPPTKPECVVIVEKVKTQGLKIPDSAKEVIPSSLVSPLYQIVLSSSSSSSSPSIDRKDCWEEAWGLGIMSLNIPSLKENVMFHRLFLHDPDSPSPNDLLLPVRQRLYSIISRQKPSSFSSSFSSSSPSFEEDQIYFSEYFADYDEPFVRKVSPVWDIDLKMRGKLECGPSSFSSFSSSLPPSLSEMVSFPLEKRIDYSLYLLDLSGVPGARLLLSPPLSSSSSSYSSSSFTIPIRLTTTTEKGIVRIEKWRLIAVCGALRLLLTSYWRWAFRKGEGEEGMETKETEGEKKILTLGYKKSILLLRLELEALLLHSVAYNGGSQQKRGRLWRKENEEEPSSKSGPGNGTINLSDCSQRQVQVGALFQTAVEHVEMVNQLTWFALYPSSRFRLQEFFNGRSWGITYREHLRQQLSKNKPTDTQSSLSSPSPSPSPSEPTPTEGDEPESDLQLVDRLLNEVVFFQLPPELLELISVIQVIPKSKNNNRKKKKKKSNLNYATGGGTTKRNPFALLAKEND